MIDEYLTLTELAARLKLSPKSVSNKISSGVFQCGTHYFRPRGMSVRFKWSAIQSWLETPPTPPALNEPLIPVARCGRRPPLTLWFDMATQRETDPPG